MIPWTLKRYKKLCVFKALINSLRHKLNIAPTIKTLSDLTDYYNSFQDPLFHEVEDLIIYYSLDKNINELYQEIKNSYKI